MDEAEREARRALRDQWARATLARQIAVVDDLAARAQSPVGWLGVQRQARSALRHLSTWAPARLTPDLIEATDANRVRLQRSIDDAELRLAGLDSLDRAEANDALGLRVAVIGKGGAGKTVLSSTLSRLLARRGREVLAVDLDTCPGMSYSIGLGGVDAPLPVEALEESKGAAYGWQLASGLLPHQAVERFAATAPDGVRFLSLGKIGEVDKQATKRTVTATVQLLGGFGEPTVDVVADLEAGPTTPFERYHAFADIVIVVVGPAWRSAMTARRLLPMVGEGRIPVIVANRFQGEPDHPGLQPTVRFPFDPEVADAERQGLAPLDVCPDSPVIAAIEALADRLRKASLSDGRSAVPVP